MVHKCFYLFGIVACLISGKSNAGKSAKKLIVTGDDFGLSPGVNAGIIEAYKKGILTHASLMVNALHCEEALRLAKDNPGLGVGIHLALVDGYPTLPPSDIPDMVDKNGRLPKSGFHIVLKIALKGKKILRQIEAESRAQIEKFLGYGVKLGYLDSHKYVHMFPPVSKVILGLSKEYAIPRVRYANEKIGLWRIIPLGRYIKTKLISVMALLGRDIFKSYGFFAPVHFFGCFHSGKMDKAKLLKMLRNLPFGESEIVAHPNVCNEECPSLKGYDTEAELEALKDKEVLEYIKRHGIELAKCQ